jgi:hypothetical protein
MIGDWADSARSALFALFRRGLLSLYINASSAPPFGGEAAASCPRPCGDGEELAVACAADIRMGFAGIRR